MFYFGKIILTIFILLQSTLVLSTLCWNYQTECTKTYTNQFDSQQHDINKRNYEDYYKKISATSILKIQQQASNSLELKCPQLDQYLFIGQTQYGVSSLLSINNDDDNICSVKYGDCLVMVDYLGNECNGLNTCSIQLDAQYLHSCKNYSNYISIAYECLNRDNQIDICSNRIIENSNGFILKTPNYPNEYENNLKNCTCNIQVQDDREGGEEEEKRLNLKFELLEYDVEEGEANAIELCNKDKMTINDSKTNQTRKLLCGQHKEFKEFNLASTGLTINFTTDDSISRRGFLMRIKSINESKCPYNSKYYNDNKCVKLISKKYLNYKNSNNYCKLLNGNLFEVDSFDDIFKLNLYTNNKNNDIWIKNDAKSSSSLNIKKQNEDVDGRCLIKRGNNYFYENCNKNLQFICEFNITTNEMNKKIKVSCGQSRRGVVSTTTVTSKTIVIIENEVLELEKQQQTLKVEKTIKKIDNQSNENFKNSDFVLIIGAVSGILIVIIILNVFLIWNYYNRKLKGVFVNKKTKEAADDDDKNANNIFYPSSSSSSTPTISNLNEINKTNDFIYLQNATTDMLIKNDYFKDFLNTDNFVIPHVYESIPSVHYCQQIPPPYASSMTSTSSNNSYLIDYSNTCLLLPKQTISPSSGPILVLNGQNYYLNPATIDNSQIQLSTCSSTSSTRPLTN